jgi:hypothetical protein
MLEHALELQRDKNLVFEKYGNILGVKSSEPPSIAKKKKVIRAKPKTKGELPGKKCIDGSKKKNNDEKIVLRKKERSNKVLSVPVTTQAKSSAKNQTKQSLGFQPNARNILNIANMLSSVNYRELQEKEHHESDSDSESDADRPVDYDTRIVSICAKQYLAEAESRREENYRLEMEVFLFSTKYRN